jgi:molybdate transport system substrate-binding protein
MRRVKYTILGYFLIASLIPWSVSASESVMLYAAGSLKDALTQVVSAYEQNYRIPVNTKFGPSGLLRKAIEEGDAPDIFASANMNHPEALADAGWGGPVVLFARNQLCALSQPGVKVTTDTLLTVLLDENIRVGTSTPKADPSGDYAWELFKKADSIKQGSFDTLSGKALQLTGGPDSQKAPEGKNLYGWIVSDDQADVFLTYSTNAVMAKKQFENLKIIQIQPDLTVGADYGLIVKDGASMSAWRLAMFILSQEGRKILAEYGFGATAN